ncbi:MAG: MFS transporter [Bdellovibrionaceae bacterium]|nr:MFS transporter [Pseudobdellovibrionaceae bacterium]
MWSPFRYRSYTLFWICAFLSNLGTWIRDVAASWVMTHLTHSPLVISFLAFSSSLPIVLFSIPAGFWADHGNRRKILLLAQALMMISSAVLGVQAATGSVTETSMLLLSFMMGIGVALNGPAYQTVLSELVPAHEQQNAVLVYYIGLNMTRVIGPAIGGFVLGFAGAQNAFFLDAVFYSGLIVYYYRWPLKSAEVARPLQKLTKSDWLILFSRKNSALWVEIFFVSFAASCLWALYPVRGRIELHLESLQYGSLLGCLGLGAFLSALFANKLMNPSRTRESLSFAYLIFAAGEVTLAFADGYATACLAMTLAGVGWIVLATLMNMSTRGLAANSQLKATMLGVFLAVFYLGMSIGSITWGLVANQLSSSKALMVSSGLLLLIGLLKYRNFGNDGKKTS